MHSISPPFSAGVNNFQLQVLKREDKKKMTVWANFKSFCHAEYLPRGTCYFSCQKKTFKINYVFEFTISNVGLGLL